MADDRDDDELYRRLIDLLVDACREGQGQLGAERARSGVWNRNAVPGGAMDPAHETGTDEMRAISEASYREQYAINMLLKRLSQDDREVLAVLLADEFRAGVFQVLDVLYEVEVAPFDRAYEGAPFDDFHGRLDDWPWPGPDIDRF